jgi:hypothetical protein
VEEPPRKRFDAATLAFHGTAIALVVVIAGYLLYKVRTDPEPAPVTAKDGSVADVASDIRKWIEDKRAELQPSPPPAPAKPQAPARAETQGRAITSVGKGKAQYPRDKDQLKGPLLPLEANRVWRYSVSVDPPTWRDVALTYRVPLENGHLVAYTDFTHSAGSMRFRLGALEAGDPAHANVRFPGFFLHAAYIAFPLAPGQRVTWSWPWQPVRPGRIKQFEGEVKGWEQVTVPLGTFEAVRIDAVIKYIDNGHIGGTARETIWLSPRAQGVVKVVREGVAPDEGFKRIVAELAEFK